MANAAELLQSLRDDPMDEQALAGLLESDLDQLRSEESARLLSATRRMLRDRGALEVASKILDLEISASTETDTQVRLLSEQGTMQLDELGADDAAQAYFRRALELDQDNREAKQNLDAVELIRENAPALAEKFKLEADAATDRDLASRLLASAAMMLCRVAPDSDDIDLLLNQALERAPRNRRAEAVLKRRLRVQARWEQLAELLRSREAHAQSADERAALLSDLADALSKAGKEDEAHATWRQVLTVQPGHRRATSILVGELEERDDAEGLVEVYEKALSGRKAGDKDEEVGLLMQLGMLLWTRVEDLDRANEYFRRVRKLDPSHPKLLEFYRDYYPARGEGHKLLQLLRQAVRQVPEGQAERRNQLLVEMAGVAEDGLSNLEKAIDAWKQVLRGTPDHQEGHQALKRLYRKTEKWNALLDLIKDEIETLPEDDVAGRIALYEEVVTIYRDRLNLPTMVISTYNSILALQPENLDALAALAEKYEQLGRWNDLIAVLGRQVASSRVDEGERIRILRRMADLWVEQFGNFAQAIGPLEELLAIRPGDAEAIVRLKQIYERRRQWRPLLELLEREALHQDLADRREHYMSMARLAAERLGDARMAIELWNRVAEIPVEDGSSGHLDPQVIEALTSLYEREKRYTSLAEMYRRQADLVGRDSRAGIGLLERLGNLFADRLHAPAQAADVYREILEHDPHNGRALRTLRELYAQSGDFDELERMFAELGEWADLVDSLSTIADRVDDRDRRVELLTRAAHVAAERFDSKEKIARAYERVLSVDGTNLEAARALIPIYRDVGKWARLLAIYEIVLEHADSDDRRLELILEIRDLCEAKMQSKAMAFQWSKRAYALAPNREGMVDDLERLGMQADAWDEVATVLEERAGQSDVDTPERLALYRRLGKLAADRLHNPDRARAYQRKVLELDPEDTGASEALERIAREQADWPNLLKIYRTRAESESDVGVQVEQLFRIAKIEESQMGDRSAAARTYLEIVEKDARSRRAVKALAKLREEEGDVEGLIEMLGKEIELTDEPAGKVDLYLRIGSLHEGPLAEPDQAIDAYREAMQLEPQRLATRDALERYLDTGRDIDPERRVEVATLLLPHFEQGEDPERLARVIGVLRTNASQEQALIYDKRLVDLYARLERLEDAYVASTRVLQADPMDADNRESFLRFGGELGRWEETARGLQTALGRLVDADADAGILREIAESVAELYDIRVLDPDRAERAWRKVVDIDPTDANAYEALQRLYNSSSRYQELRDLLVERVENTSDADQRKDLLLLVAELDQDVLGDREGAIEAYLGALELDPSLMLAYKALERLYHDGSSWQELDGLLARENDYVDSDSEHVELTSRRATIKADKLGDVSGALELAEDVIARAPNHGPTRGLLEGLLSSPEHGLRVARTLEPLYREDGMWRDLAAVLRAQITDDLSVSERVDLLAQAAAVDEERLGNVGGAFATWSEAFALDPSADGPRRALLRLAAQTADWETAASAFEKALESAEIDTKRQLLVDLAEIYDRHVGDVDGALRAYRGLLELDPGNPETARPALRELDRIYEAYQRWSDLAPVVRQLAEWAESSEERRDLFTRLAGIYEHNLNDDGQAIATWRDVLVDEPDDARALDALERLYIAGDKHSDLVGIIRQRVDGAHDEVDKLQQLQRLAALHELELEQPEEAIVTLLEVLDFAPTDDKTLVELARLYRQDQRFPDLYEMLARRHELAQVPELEVELGAELGELLHSKLDRSSEALDRFADVLAHRPDHERAIEAVEAIFRANVDLQGRAAAILEPLYRSQERFAELSAMQSTMVEHATDPRERMQRLLALATLREGQLGDPEAAYAAYSDALRLAAGEPELGDILKQTERLATQLEQRRALIEIYRTIAPDVLDGQIQCHLYLTIADLAWTEQRDALLAREYYQLVMDQMPNDDRAILALQDIYNESEDWESLSEVLGRKAEQAGDDLDARVAALSQLAAVADDKLGRLDEAVLAWESVMELVPDHQQALDALEGLYKRGERWHDLADLVERRLGYTFDTHMAVELRFELGKLYEEKLSDPDNAVASYAAALDGLASHQGARVALERYLDDPATRGEAARTLEPIYVSQQDWPNLVRIYEIKLEAAEDRDERLMLVRYIARLYEEQLEDLDGAFRWYGRVFREDPGDLGVRDQLMRLASVLESWRDLANVYQEYLDDETEDSEELLSVAASLAEIYDRRLSEIEPAHVCYRRVLSAQPDDGKVFAKLESMLRRAQRWYAVVELYEDTVEASLDDERRLKLLLQTALVLEQELEDPGRAVDTYRAVLDISPDHRTAIQELERLYEELERWQDLAELLQRQVDDAIDDQAANFFRLRLAEVLETHLDDVNVAIDHYQVALDYPGAQTALSALERLVLRDDLRERIAGVLEPLYRANDWWQKLVIILDARLEYVDDPSDRRRMLREIAQIHEARGGDQSLALRALARAWQDDIRDEEVYDELAALVAKQGAWDQLIEAMEAGIADTYDYEQAAVVLGRVAEIHENQRGDIGAAIAAWTRLLEIKDDDGHALAELDRLYDQEERWAEQVKMIKRRADLAADAVVQVTLLRRAAERLERQLQDVDGAIVEYRNILGADDVNGDALDALERLYRQVQDWTELGQILVRKLEVEEHADERRRLRFDASEVFDQHLKDVYEAIAMMTAQLEEAATDGEALATLDRLYGREAMWSELLEVLDRRIELAEDAAAAAELGYRAAKVVEDKLVDPHGAIERYAAVIVLVPVHRGAREALDKLTRNDETLWSAADVLERLYRSENDFESVAELYERRLSSDSGDPDARPGYFQELARIHESSRADVDSAFRVWARALAENPERAELRGELERIVVTTGEWKHLAAEFENRLDDATDPELEFVYADELGRIYDQYLDDLGRSADRLRRALACADDEAAALAKLANVYSRSSQWPELAETLERQAQVAELEDEQAQYLFLLADVRETRLGLLPDAVEALREVVERDPAHVGARSALWRLLAHDTLRSEIIVILEPLFEDEQNFAQLADLLVHKLSVTDDAFERAALYSRLSELCEQNLSDPIRALDAAGGWLAEDPQSDEALANLGRLADVTGRYDEMAARLKGILDSGAADVMRPVLLGQLGSTYLDRLNEVDRAEKCFRDLATLEPDSTVALESLERIFRERGDSRMLAETLHRLAEQEGEPQKKKSLLAEVGGLRAQLGDLNGAAEIWREVLEVDEADDRAHQSLSEIYESKGQWHELIDILGIAANHASEPAIEQQLRARIAHVYADQLGELDAAAEAWTRVLDVEPSDLAALASLEAVQVQLQDWDAVRETLLRRLDVVDEGQQLDVLSRLVELALDKRDSPEEAVAHTLQVLEIDPHHQGAADKLEELYRAGEQWHELIELFEQRAELYDGDDRGVDYLARVADVWEGPLENPDAAAEVLEKILERDENYVPALTRLAKIYEANSDWDRCEEILQKALGLGPTGSQAADLHFRLAEVARAKDGDDEAARGHYHQALSDEPTHLPSIVAIGSIAREREDWPTLADMLTRQLEQVSEGDEMIELAVELARLQSKELGRAAEAVHVLEQVAQSAPDDPRVLGPLADAYFDAGRVEEAAPMYETLANEAKRGRRMKDLARYKQRIGGIYEAARDLEQALAAYEEAFRVDPTNAQTMAGLGRMYVDAQNWDKARRVYRSMVLQDLEENVGITKAEVFYNLGYIHVQLGELRKAKNMFQRGLELAPDDERLQAGLESVSD